MADVTVDGVRARNYAATLREMNAERPHPVLLAVAELLDQPSPLRAQAREAFVTKAEALGWNVEEDGEDMLLVDAVLAVVREHIEALPSTRPDAVTRCSSYKTVLALFDGGAA